MSADQAEAPVLRPRPMITRDTAFFWEGLKAHKLLIQRCKQCGRLRHPPGPSCPYCYSLEWDTVEASGEATLATYTVLHKPLIPPFVKPQQVGVVTLKEGTNLVAELLMPREAIQIGMALKLDFIDADPDLTLPAFRPAEAR
jgi:uncharacterized OB-fold protein